MITWKCLYKLVLVNNCVGDFVWRFMQALESLYL